MSPRFKYECEQGRSVFPRIGEMTCLAGILKMPLSLVGGLVGYYKNFGILENGTPNTAFAHHQKKTYALVENNLPFNIKIDRDKNGESFDILSIGHDDFGGQLQHAVSAHPKVNRKTGELFAFCYSIRKPAVDYTLFNRDRKAILNIQIPLKPPH